jgi:FAD:protein FMN transferase
MLGNSIARLAVKVPGHMAISCALMLVALCVSGCSFIGKSIHENQRHFLAMDTSVDITVYSVGDPQAALDAVQQTFTHYDALFSISNPASDIWKINHRTGSTVNVSPLTVDVARFASQECMATQGVFDVTVAPLKYLYGLEAHQEQHRVPEASELNRVRSVIGCQHYRVINDSALALDNGVTLDFGGIVKGFIMANVKDRLIRAGVKGFLINVGGDIYVWGQKPKHQPWKIGVRDPRGESGDLIGALNVQNTSVFTSGDYERFFIKDGVRYHHIFDPTTLMPARYNRSATVVGADPLQVDASVKAAFCMPAERAIEYLRSRHLSGVLIDSSGAVWVSSELHGQFEMAVPSVTPAYR